jgi:carbonic anhydrase/acetyltransferase-like protein (isoleucine patch superfamily)
MTVTVTNCADENTPEGKYAHVEPSARVGARLGFWTKIGHGVVVPRSAHLGSWTTIGHYSRIGWFVQFGPWASVGMDSRVEFGSVLGDHEYVLSGCRRTRSGKLVDLPVSDEDRLIHYHYDRAHYHPSGAYPLEEYERLERDRLAAAVEVARLLPDYLARKDARR